MKEQMIGSQDATGKNERAKQEIFPEVEEKFKNGFPEGYRPWVDGWSFNIDQLQKRLPDGTYSMITLDLSISDDEYVKTVNEGPKKDISKRAEENYKCEIGCKHCFECKTDTNNDLMTFDEIKNVVLDAKKIGLETVKFLGPGELVHNPKLFEILDYFEKENIKIGIFTKGVIFGDDELAKKIFNMSADDLCQKISKYNCARLLIGFTSADPETEHNRLQTSIKDFSVKRNKGIENMVKEGLSADPNNQKLALICAPILKDNIDEAFNIFKWGVKRNIPVVLTPTMVSGKGLDMPEIQDEQFKNEQLVDLYAKIYTWLIEQGIMTAEQLEKEGVSPYAGFACNQFISGMFIRKDGRVQACPGNETEDFRYTEDIRKDNLKKVWKNSMGYKLRGELLEKGEIVTTHKCYAKTEGELLAKGSIPENFYQAVLNKTKEKIKG